MTIKTLPYEIYKCKKCGKLSWKHRGVVIHEHKCQHCLKQKFINNINKRKNTSS